MPGVMSSFAYLRSRPLTRGPSVSWTSRTTNGRSPAKAASKAWWATNHEWTCPRPDTGRIPTVDSPAPHEGQPGIGGKKWLAHDEQ